MIKDADKTIAAPIRAAIVKFRFRVAKSASLQWSFATVVLSVEAGG
jgi:hypothetical protein